MNDAAAGRERPALGPAFDLLAAYPGHAGFLLDRRGRGVAAGPGGWVDRDAGPSGIRRLSTSAIDRMRDAQDGAVAVGIVPFDPDEAATVRVPDVAVRRLDGRAEMVVTSDAGLPTFGRTTSVPAEAFTELQLRHEPSPEGYLGAVRTAVGRIADGGLAKVVLARTVRVEAGRPLDPRALVARLRAVDPDAYAFAIPTGPSSSLVGATPELLVRTRGRLVESRPLAGSAPRGGDREADRALAQALLDSDKDREEHRLVVDAIAEVLGGMCDELEWDKEPVLHETANVWHLATGFRGMLRDSAPSALDVVAALHPTPAVGGTPRREALALIGELEPFERGAYAGAVGWFDASGDGEFVIALRCAELEGDRATLFAGAGIVAGSVPDRELDETERKFRAFLDALRWG